MRALAPASPDQASSGPDTDVQETGRQTLDEVVLDYLVTRDEGETLKLALEEEIELASGEEVEMVLVATANRAGTPLSDVVIDVKLICSARPPEVLGMGHTDSSGRAFVRIFVPSEGEGAAALIVTATSVIGGTELKFLL